MLYIFFYRTIHLNIQLKIFLLTIYYKFKIIYYINNRVFEILNSNKTQLDL